MTYVVTICVFRASLGCMLPSITESGSAFCAFHLSSSKIDKVIGCGYRFHSDSCASSVHHDDCLRSSGQMTLPRFLWRNSYDGWYYLYIYVFLLEGSISVLQIPDTLRQHTNSVFISPKHTQNTHTTWLAALAKNAARPTAPVVADVNLVECVLSSYLVSAPNTLKCK